MIRKVITERRTLHITTSKKVPVAVEGGGTRYERVSATKEYAVEMTVEIDRLMHDLAQRAAGATTKRASARHGMIKCKVKEVTR